MIIQMLQDALNEQIRNEMYSSFVYLSMSAHFESENLPGLSAWMRAQAGEEHGHAMKLFDHILDRGGRVKMPGIQQPPVQFTTPATVFEQALLHERAVTKNIHDLYAMALDEKDYPARVFLDWFVNEQVEEEKTAELIAEQLKMIGDDRSALLQLDRELGQRKGGEEGDGHGKHKHKHHES